MKNLTQAVIDKLQSGSYTYCQIVRMNLNDGAGGTLTYRFTEAGHDIVYNGDTYVSSGLAIGFGSIKHQQELRIASIDLQFSAVDQTLPALFLTSNQQNRRVTISTLILDNDTHAVIGLLHNKRFNINNFSIDDDAGKASITVNVSNFLSQFQATRGIRTTQSSHARIYHGTTSFINSKDSGANLEWAGE